MESEHLQQLQQRVSDAEAFETSILRNLEETRHRVGECSEKLTRINGQMALLEASHEADEELAKKMDVLKSERDDAEAAYREQTAQESRLKKMGLDAISHLKVARNELKIAQLKSGS
ncbi:hypothetical protein [Endozoicomonas sp. 8E]|uniref:hypothetical protein n=1 Tax=Endozoicomonas sp. 8E TaxID=3035692 RepID=UPI0029394321|nr:hypothetical protein [Endozoicomonas sp. 8E]WOG27733.1 hypothetical protein P6910_24820 [Endozoicomonas sp. 8E]